jgi:hypothetical protein
MDFTLNSIHGGASVAVERDYDGDVMIIPSGGTVYLDDAGTRDFARKLMAFVENTAETAHEVAATKVGDRVEITKYRDDDRTHVGKFGTVTQIDTDDIPFLVHADGYGAVWAMGVRKVTPTASPSRSAALDEARRIAGPDASAADVLAYAKWLAE